MTKPVSTSNFGLAPPLTLEGKKAFMRLPMEERRHILAQQAKEMAEYYERDQSWRDIQGGDILDEY